MQRKFFRKSQGYVLGLVIAILLGLGFLVYTMIAYNIGSHNVVTSVDVARQRMVERRGFEQILREAIIQQVGVHGVSGDPYAASIGQDFVSRLSVLLEGTKGVAYGFSGRELGYLGNATTAASFATQFSSKFKWPVFLSDNVTVGTGGGFETHVFGATGYATMYPFSGLQKGLVTSHLADITMGTVYPALGGLGQGVLDILTLGPFTELTGASSGAFPWAYPDNLRTDTNSGPWEPVPVFNRYLSTKGDLSKISSSDTYPIIGSYRLFMVPLTNFTEIIYGMPSINGGVPFAPPPERHIPEGSRPLLVTMNDPVSDPTAFRDVYVKRDPEVLPYRYREAVLGAWDAFEFMFRVGWEDTYVTRLYANTSDDKRFNFAAPPLVGSMPNGFTYTPPLEDAFDQGGHLEIDLGALDSVNGTSTGSGPNWETVNPAHSLYFIEDVISSEGFDSVGAYYRHECVVVIKGTTAYSRDDAPVVIVIHNPSKTGGFAMSDGYYTRVKFEGNNTRNVLIIIVGSKVSFGEHASLGGAEMNWAGGVILDPTCVLHPDALVNLYGHFSFFHKRHGDVGEVKVFHDEHIMRGLAAVSPRILVPAVRFR